MKVFIRARERQVDWLDEVQCGTRETGRSIMTKSESVRV